MAIRRKWEHMFVFRHSLATRRSILGLVAVGVSDRQISLRTGISRSTVRSWRRDPAALSKALQAGDPQWRPPEGPTYCYLLGLYLGDGCITTRGNHASIAITLDALYPAIIGQTMDALAVTFPRSAVRPYRHPVDRKTVVCLTHRSLPNAFPQHGAGRKHERLIELVPWQVELTRAFPERLIRDSSTPTERAA